MIRWVKLKRNRGKVVLAILLMLLFLLSTYPVTTLNQNGGYNTLTENLLIIQSVKNHNLTDSKDYEIGISTELDTKNFDYLKGCLTLRFEISSFKYEEGLFYFDGCKFLYSEGMPVLPYTQERFILPRNSIIENLQVDVENQEYLFPNYIRKYTDNKMPVVQNYLEIFPDKSIILSDEPSDTRIGVDLWYVAIYPLQVFQNETVLLNKEMTIRISFQSDNSIAPSKHSDKVNSGFAINALSKFSGILSELQLERGVRTQVKGNPSFIIIGDPTLHSMAVAYSFYRTLEGQKHYGLICLNPNETERIPEFSLKLQEMGFNQPQIIDSTANLINLIKFGWNHAPYLVIADSKVCRSATPLAAFLNYPLIVYPTVSNNDINSLTSQLRVRGIILCGNITGISFGNLDIIELADEAEVNQFLYTFQHQTGFIEKEFKAYTNQFLATVLNGHDYTLFTNEDTQTRQGVHYLVCYDGSKEIEFATAAQDLASYRGAVSVDVGSYTSSEIRSLLDSYDPLYVAFYGDGDDGEAGCYFVSDPTGDTGDPALISTDFYYAERDQCQPDGAWSRFSVDSYVGRPIATNDAYAQLYVNLVATYESTNITSYDYVNRVALFSWGFGIGDATDSVHDKLVAAGAIYHPVYTRSSGTFTKYNVLAELDNGVQIAYFNTHGSFDRISMGSGGYLIGTDLIGYNFTNHPPFVYVDACLTARFAGDGGGKGSYDDDWCIATQFMNFGILGYLGSTMNSYVGAFDSFDKCFFEYFKTDEPLEIGLIVGSALEDYYRASTFWGSLDEYEEKTILEVMLLADPMLKIQFGSEPPPSPLQSLIPLVLLSQSQSSGTLGLRLVQIFGAVGLIGIIIVAVRGTGKYAEPVDWYTPEPDEYF